jgi:hypothetical protein
LDASVRIFERSSTRSSEDFVLDSFGAFVKAQHAQDMNTSWSHMRPEAAPGITREPLPSPRILNIRYSFPAQFQSHGSACGASPMNPGEIANLVGLTAKAYGVDPELAQAIAWVESRFDQTRNSPKGARGPMQLMPDTALSLGVQDLCDPASNIDGGIRHLKALIDEFKNPLVAAAAYNAGSKAIYDNGGIPPYGETIRYVAAVINRQLGLQLPAPERKAAITANNPPLSDGQAGDVTGGRGSRFVNGVMHF